MKAKQLYSPKEEPQGIAIDCPGCQCLHVFDDRWSFNGDFEKPTFRPSLKVTYPGGKICHSYVTDGKINLLRDCTQHELKGIIDLSNID